MKLLINRDKEVLRKYKMIYKEYIRNNHNKLD
jgi:hypothetical protein